MRHKISNISDQYLSVCYTPFSGLVYDIHQWVVDEGDPAKRLAAGKKGIALDLCSLEWLRGRIFWRAVKDTYLLEKEHSVNVTALSPCWRNVRKRYYAKQRKQPPRPPSRASSSSSGHRPSMEVIARKKVISRDFIQAGKNSAPSLTLLYFWK